MVRGLTAALIVLIDAVENTVDIPEPCCNCANAPPCHDCVEWSLLRVALSAAKAAIAMPKAAAPQPAAVKQDLTTAQSEAKCIWPDCGHDTNCVGYGALGCDSVGCPKQQRLREMAAAEQASYVGAGAHGIADEPQPEAKAGAEVTDAMIDAGHAAMRRISFAASPREQLSAMWYAMSAAQPTPAEGGAVAWITDQPTVCNGGITRDKRIADAWKDNGWNVTALAPAAATRAEEAERYAIHWAERDAQGVVSIHRASPNDWPDWVHRKQPGPDFPKRERWEDRAPSLGEALRAEKPIPKCSRCGALTDLVCGNAECGNRNQSA